MNHKEKKCDMSDNITKTRRCASPLQRKTAATLLVRAVIATALTVAVGITVTLLGRGAEGFGRDTDLFSPCAGRGFGSSCSPSSTQWAPILLPESPIRFASATAALMYHNLCESDVSAGYAEVHMKAGHLYASDLCLYSSSLFVLNFTKIGPPSAERWAAGLTEEDSAHVSISGGSFGAAPNEALRVTFLKRPSEFAPVFLNITGVFFRFSSVLIFSGVPPPRSQILITNNTFVINVPNNQAGSMGILLGIAFSNVIPTDLSTVDFVLSGSSTRIRIADNSVTGALHYANPPVLNQKTLEIFFILIIATRGRLSGGARLEVEGNIVANGPSFLSNAPKDIFVVALLMSGILQIQSGATLSLSSNRLGSAFTDSPSGDTNPMSSPSHNLPEPQTVVHGGASAVLLRGDNNLYVTGAGSRVMLDGNTITRIAPGYFPAGAEFVVSAARILMRRMVVSDSALVSLNGNVAAGIGSNADTVTAVASLLEVTGEGPAAIPAFQSALQVTGGATLRLRHCVSALHTGRAVIAAAAVIRCEADPLLLASASVAQDLTTTLRVAGGGVGPSAILISDNVVWGVRQQAMRIFVVAIIAPRLLIESDGGGGGGTAMVTLRRNNGIDNEVTPKFDPAALPRWGFSRELQTVVLIATATAMTVLGPNTALRITENGINTSTTIFATAVDVRIRQRSSKDFMPMVEDDGDEERGGYGNGEGNTAAAPLCVGPGGGSIYIAENSVLGIRNTPLTPTQSVAYRRLCAVALTVNGSIVVNASSSFSSSVSSQSNETAAVVTSSSALAAAIEISRNVVDGGFGGALQSAFAVVVSAAGALDVIARRTDVDGTISIGSAHHSVSTAAGALPPALFNISDNSLGRFIASTSARHHSRFSGDHRPHADCCRPRCGARSVPQPHRRPRRRLVL